MEKSAKEQQELDQLMKRDCEAFNKKTLVQKITYLNSLGCNKEKENKIITAVVEKELPLDAQNEQRDKVIKYIIDNIM